jgi:integrase
MDATLGKQRCERAPIQLGVDKDLAIKFAEKLEEKLRAQAEIAGKKRGPLTVRTWFTEWTKRRTDEGIATADNDEARIRLHVLKPNPWLADMPLDEVRRRHTKSVLSKLKSRIGSDRNQLGSRTVRNIWAAFSSMFEDAVDSEVISANPCKLKRGSLPKRSDKSATWRSTAIFTRREIEQILVDEHTPHDRRIFYATCFFAGGARFGEAAARRWRDYDPDLQPLGRLKIETSYSTKTKKEKKVKTEVARNVPVHGVYAALLAEWKLFGWEQLMGRKPTADDLIIPSRENGFRNANHMLHRFHEDLERIGLRKRRLHDLRRTFISLCREDGANKELLRWITHGVTADVMDTYTTPTWEALCSQISTLKIDLRRGEVIALAKAAGGGGGFSDENSSRVTTLLPVQAVTGREGSEARSPALHQVAPVATLRTDDHRESPISTLTPSFRVPSAPRLNAKILGTSDARGLGVPSVVVRL